MEQVYLKDGKIVPREGGIQRIFSIRFVREEVINSSRKRAYGHGPFGVNFRQVSIGFLEEQSKLLSDSYAAQTDTFTSPGPQHASFAPDLHTSSISRPAACLLRSRSAYLYTSTSTRLQPTSRAPELHTSTSPRRHACSPSPYLRTSSSLHVQHASRAPDLF